MAEDGGQGARGPGLEARLAELLAAGDHKQAATEAIRAYAREIHRHLNKLLGDSEDAREAFARASESLWRGLPGFRGGSSVRTWFFRLALNAAADLRRDKFRARGRRLETDEAAGLKAPGTSRTTSQVRQERRRVTLQELRGKLTLPEQCLLQLRIDHELSWEECARVLSEEGKPLSAEAVMKRYERIKRRLGREAARRRG